MPKKYFFLSFASLCVIFFVVFYSLRDNGEPVQHSTPSVKKVIRDNYEAIIIGSGPAGLTAGIYLGRAERDVLIIEGREPGGLLAGNPEVGNWPGEKNISGDKLMESMREHAVDSGCDFLSAVVTDVDFSEKPYKLTTRSGKKYTAKSVIIAMGAKRKKIGCPGEKKYWKRGVSACAVCDAAFFRDKCVAVIGAGTVALIEAHHLAHFAKKVIIISKYPEFKTFDPIKHVTLKDPNVEVRYGAMIKEIKGDGRRVTGVVIEEDSIDEEKKSTLIKVDGVFVAVGFLPNTTMFEGKLDLNDGNYIEVHDGAKTSVDGVFAAGDITNVGYKQAVVAAGQGCNAALCCQDYLDLK